MLLTTEHIQLVELLNAGSSQRRGVTPMKRVEAPSALWRVLEVQGLLAKTSSSDYALTAYGKETARLLQRMLFSGVMPGAAEIEPGWRFLGSEVVAALDAAARCNGRVGPLTENLLAERSMVESPNDFQMGIQHLRLNSFGRAWLDLSRRCCPILEVTGELAAALLELDLSGASGRRAGAPPADLALLEAMELLAWSVPDAATYVLTSLGQAVYDTLRSGAVPTRGIVLDGETLRTLAHASERGAHAVSVAQLETLQGLGYLDSTRALTTSGTAAIGVYSLLRSPATQRVATFSMSVGEVEMLEALHDLTATGSNAEPGATLAAMRSALITRGVRAYHDIGRRFGSELEDSLPARKQTALATFEELKEHSTFAAVRDAEDELLHLESLDLVRSDGRGRATTYRLTPRGHEVVDEQLGADHHLPRAISADAVRAVTWGGQHHTAPTTTWIEAGQAEGLLGAGGVTPSGRRYAALATSGTRELALTKCEAHALLAQAEPELRCPRMVEATTRQALDRLEARGLIERQVDGQVLRTKAGDLLAQAVTSAVDLAYPVTPSVIRLLEAMRRVTAADVKESRHMTPEKWRDVECSSGLSRQAFSGALYLARFAGYVSAEAMEEPGMLLLEAAATLCEYV